MDDRERELRELNQKLEQRADQLRDLALAMADSEAAERKRLAQRLHDGFQQLLSAARIKAAIVRRKLDDPAAKQGLIQVERLVEDAINESRTLTNELNPPVLYDAGLGIAVEAMVRKFERERGLKITVEGALAAAEPETEQLRVILFEAVRELLTNVAEHSQAKSAKIRIDYLPQQVEITVSDDGIGFDPAAVERNYRQEKLFGLLEIRERLQYIGGGMRLNSAPGKGAEVTIFVPIEHPKPSKADEQTTTAQAPTAEAITGSSDRCRIVVADDHAIFREGLINLLSQDLKLHVVGEAADGEEAIEMTRKLRPEILIVDVTMPKLSGIEVAAKLSQEMPQLKIVGLSMHEHEDMARAMRRAGAAAYITKGGSSEALLSLLRGLTREDSVRSSS